MKHGMLTIKRTMDTINKIPQQPYKNNNNRNTNSAILQTYDNKCITNVIVETDVHASLTSVHSSVDNISACKDALYCCH